MIGNQSADNASDQLMHYSGLCMAQHMHIEAVRIPGVDDDHPWAMITPDYITPMPGIGITG